MKLKSFSSVEIGDYIELPNWAELLFNPFFHFADVDFAYKYGTEFQRYLIDNTPFKNNSDRITIFFEVRVSSPNLITSFVDNDGWHCDNLDNDFNREGVNHLLTSKTSFMTEFIDEDILIPNNVQKTMPEVTRYVNELSNKGLLKTTKMPHNRIVTFGDIYHRASISKGVEFRLIYRAQELSNQSKKTHPTNNTICSSVSSYDLDKNYITNIQKTKDKIDIMLY